MSMTTGLSPMCLSGLQSSLTTGPFQQCANVTGLESIIKTNGSIVMPLDRYLMDTCPRPGCSNETLSNATSIIMKDCSANATVDGIDIGKYLPAVVENFNNIKAAACIEHTSNHSYCIPELLTNLEHSTGLQFNVSTIESLASEGVTGLLARFSSVPSDVYCNECGSAFVTEALMVAERFNLSSSTSSTIRSYAQRACSNYTNFGGMSLPSGIMTANSTSSDSGKGRNHARAFFLD